MILSFSLVGQEQIKATRKAKEISYNLIESRLIPNKVLYRNTSNKLFAENWIRPKKYSSHLFDQIPFFDKANDPRENVDRMIAEALSLKQIQGLQGENPSPHLFLYFDYPGNLLEMAIIINKTSIFTAEDIESIETNLKRNLKVNFTSPFLEGSNFIPVSFNIDPKRILAYKLGSVDENTDISKRFKYTFYANKYDQKLTDPFIEDSYITYEPLWESMVSSKKDSSDYYFVSLLPRLRSKSDNAVLKRKINTSHNSYLIIMRTNKKVDYFLGKYQSEEVGQPTPKTSLHNFTGTLLLTDLSSGKISMVRYKNGSSVN